MMPRVSTKVGAIRLKGDDSPVMESGWREIPLTRGLVAIVDDADFDALALYRWRVLAAGKGRFYAIRGQYPNHVLMHRQIAGALRDEYVDHADGNTLNNQRSNLRRCTPAENAANRRTIRASSGFKGVGEYGHHGWVARYKQRHLGVFKTAEEAAHAYDEALMLDRSRFGATNEQLGAQARSRVPPIPLAAGSAACRLSHLLSR